MSFKLYKCGGPQGLPLLEAPGGRFVFERLTPGEIREADYYEQFRWGQGGKMLFACPRGKSEKGRCQVPLRLLRIRHESKALPALLKDCRSGKLYERRRKTIDQILKDVATKRSKSSGLGYVPVFEGLAGVLAAGAFSVLGVLLIGKALGG